VTLNDLEVLPSPNLRQCCH